MEHLLTINDNGIKILSIIEFSEKDCLIKVESINANDFQQVLLNKEQLHSFIGALLHVQQKMKGSK